MMGRMPSRLGYQPTMGTELSALQERIANTKSGAITSIQAVYVPADDFTRPGSGAHLLAPFRLRRSLAAAGQRRAVSRSGPPAIQLENGHPGIVGAHHYHLAQEIRRTLAQYTELKDIIAMLGLEQLSQNDRNVVARARRLERFLTTTLLFHSAVQWDGG